MTLSSVAETAKKVRKELKEVFPETKFSVKSKNFSGGSSISVKWENYPVAKDVEKKVLNKYKDVDYCEASGEMLMGGNTFVNAQNEWTGEIKEEIESQIPEGITKNDFGYFHHFHQIAEDLYQEKYIQEETKKERKEEKKNTNKGIKAENQEKLATKKQRWALYCISKIDTREMEITMEEAKDLIQKGNNGIDIRLILKNKQKVS